MPKAKDQKRASRRAGDRKALARAIAITKLQGLGGGSETEILKRARKNRDHLAKCSCQMCRNPRTSKITKGKEKLTRQERRAQKTREGLE